MYLPTRSGSTEPFRDVMDLLDSAFTIYPDCSIIFVGDFNADPGSLSSSPNEQGRILKRFLARWTFLSAHLFFHPFANVFTYESDAHSSFSNIDHILCSHSLLSSIRLSGVLPCHHLNLSDHRAIYASISVSVSTPLASVPSGQPSASAIKSKLAWSKLDDSTILSTYTEDVDVQLQSILSSPITNPEDIENITVSLTDILISAETSNIPFSNPRPYLRHKWPPAVRDAHLHSKLMYREWVRGGRPSDLSHPLKREYKDAKRAFRRAFRVLNREDMEDFYQSLDPTDTNLFKLIRQKFGSNSSQTDLLTVNGQSYTADNIPEGWAHYFNSLYAPTPQLFDSHHCDDISNRVLDILHSTDRGSVSLTFSAEDITKVISNLPKSKAAGPDSISMEHLLFAPLSWLIYSMQFYAVLMFHSLSVIV